MVVDMQTDSLGLSSAVEHQRSQRSRTPRQEGSASSRRDSRRSSGPRDTEDGAAGLTRDSAVRDLLLATARLTLATTQATKALTAATMDTLLTPKTAQVCEDIKKATKDYSDKALSLPKESKHTMGPPHIWVWQAILGSYTAQVKAEDRNSKVKEYMESIGKVAAQDKTTVIAEHVRYCRMTKCFDGSKLKIQMAICAGTPSHEAWLALRARLVHVDKAQLKVGLAPRSGLERQVQTALDDMDPTSTRGSE
eukprot:TRINITY_DN30432_c0_g2_i1.p2 TRINITY_DN30432_c0_g2~~TRINITY_DN30432_c0_g2_i1.p2  ORF type:complete len:251 (+),score=30.56 TRINITY_DN30432_c0_g2_i1:163-915(+)